MRDPAASPYLPEYHGAGQELPARHDHQAELYTRASRHGPNAVESDTDLGIDLARTAYRAHKAPLGRQGGHRGGPGIRQAGLWHETKVIACGRRPAMPARIYSDSVTAPSMHAATLLAERRLDELAQTLDQPRVFPPGLVWPWIAIMLGHRARTFFRAVRSAEHDAVAQVLVRPLAELMILLEWLAQDPPTRLPLWAAESERRDLVVISEARRTTQIVQRLPAPPIDQTAEKQAIIEKVRADARAKGVSWVGEKGSLIPGTAQMAEAVSTQTVHEAYDIAFRSTSPWTHIDAGTFGDGLRDNEEHRVFVGDTSTRWLPSLRALAASSFAVILRRISQAAELDLEQPCVDV